MTDLIQTVDWSRAQFALTAMYHWLFVPLTIGLALIVAIMETIYVRTSDPRWKGITKFWMTLFGINFGRVGFLTDAQPDHWEERLKVCLRDDPPLRACLALRWKLTRDGRLEAGGAAVNDVVLSRGSLSRLVCVHITVDGQRMGLLRSDGLILSTPVGSSGYSVSAGGPLLYPGRNAVAMTPICPFLNTISPMVFPGATVCHLRIEPGSTDCYITVDGQEGQQLEIGDLVEVTGVPAAVRFMGDEISFFERLRTRGFVLERASGADAE